MKFFMFAIVMALAFVSCDKNNDEPKMDEVFDFEEFAAFNDEIMAATTVEEVRSIFDDYVSLKSASAEVSIDDLIHALEAAKISAAEYDLLNANNVETYYVVIDRYHSVLKKVFISLDSKYTIKNNKKAISSILGDIDAYIDNAAYSATAEDLENFIIDEIYTPLIIINETLKGEDAELDELISFWYMKNLRNLTQQLRTKLQNMHNEGGSGSV